MGLALFAAMPVFAQQKATINVHPEQGKEIISKHIYGQFAEHLGTCDKIKKSKRNNIS